MPSVKFSWSFVAADGSADLEVVLPGRVRVDRPSRLVGQRAILADRRRRVVERIGTRRIGQVVMPHESIGRKHGVRTNARESNPARQLKDMMF